jgi:transcriptional repressor NrdR
MVCPKCNSNETDVIDSRNVSKTVRRRRQCSGCTYRFTTFERIERPRVVVVKKDQRREPFNREKLVGGIERACEKRDISKATIENIVDSIECAIFDKEELEVSTQKIGELVMKALASLDQVAYVRFASVYREFTDPASFTAVIKTLKKEPEETHSETTA